MPAPTIQGLATAVPPYRHAQAEIYERFFVPRLGTSRLAQAAFLNAGIAYRHSVLNDAHFYDQERSTEERNNLYMQHAQPLGAEAIRRCLDNAGLTAQDVDDLLIVSCTGLDTPGLDLLLAAQLGMRPDLRRTHIGAMGCYGAFPGLLRAADSVRARPGTRALVLCVELCTLHFQADLGLDNLISTALFADGAAAILLGDGQVRGPRLLAQCTFSDYQTLEHMAFHLTDHGFRMALSSYVPDVLRTQAGEMVEQLLAPHHLARRDIRFWGIHPGGVRILDYLQAELGLAEGDLAFSRAVLWEKGNMSSPTVLFVLEEIMRRGEPRPGDYGVLMAFGPGLTLETGLLAW